MQSTLRTLRLAAIPLIVLMAVLLAMPGTDARQPRAAADGGVVGTSFSRAERQSALDYWTEERMRNATPMPMPKASGAPSADTTSSDGPSGPPRQIAGAAPANARSWSDDEPPMPAMTSPTPTGYTYPFPFTRHAVDGSYLRYPYRTVGKMFFTQGGSNFVCSGASVVSSPQNAVYTAGHCVSDGAGAFSTNVIFVPARKTGANPYGQFAGAQLWTTSGWHFSGDLTRDFAAFSVGTNASGQTLQARVGTLGFQYDQSRVQHWDAFGYPAAGGFSGEAQITCKASHGADDTGIPGSGPDPMGIGCDMTGGSSGGPWITMFQRGSFLNSVNSYKYPSTQPNAMYGPYFDILANQVRCAAATGGSTSC